MALHSREFIQSTDGLIQTDGLAVLSPSQMSLDDMILNHHIACVGKHFPVHVHYDVWREAFPCVCALCSVDGSISRCMYIMVYRESIIRCMYIMICEGKHFPVYVGYDIWMEAFPDICTL